MVAGENSALAPMTTATNGEGSATAAATKATTALALKTSSVSEIFIRARNRGASKAPSRPLQAIPACASPITVALEPLSRRAIMTVKITPLNAKLMGGAGITAARSSG
ncbi:MAG: hypothetical protein M0004_01960 [Actinomycetota bacterium]|nr:hypothetical protein [Actinomycetota bacterium]